MIESTLLQIPLKEIDMGPRYRKDYHDVEQLAESIREKGVISPIAVMDRRPSGKPYLLLAGGRRFVAAAIAELETIPCNVYPEVDELTQRQIELYENIHREQMTYVEEAELTDEIMRLEEAKHGKGTRGPGMGATITKTAHLLGKSRALVRDELDLAQAFKEMPELKEKKNKTEAIKALRKAQEDVVREELARRLETGVHKGDTDIARKNLMNAYVVGDFFEKAKEIPAGQFHLAEIDPPYGIDLKDIKRKQYEQVTVDYNEVPVEDYKDFMRNVFAECYRVLKDNAWLICWFAPHPWWETIRQEITRAGFTLFAVPGIWYKSDSPSQTNQPKKRLASNWEPFFYAFKGDPVIQKQGRANVYPYPKVVLTDKTHPTERPVELIEAILGTFVTGGSRIIVPFAGSGNTLLAASNLSLQAVGFDLTKIYKDRYVIKVAEQEPGKYRSYR